MNRDIFKGRLNRKNFILRLFLLIIIFLIYSQVFSYVGNLLYNSNWYTHFQLLAQIIYVIVSMPWLIGFILFVSFIVRRLHDLSHQGSWVLILAFTPVFYSFELLLGFEGLIFPLLGQILLWIRLSLVALEAVFILYIFLKKGQSKANQYGPAN